MNEAKVKIRKEIRFEKISWFLNIIDGNGNVVQTLEWQGLQNDDYFWNVTAKDKRFKEKKDRWGRTWVLNAERNGQYKIELFLGEKSRTANNPFKSKFRTPTQNSKFFMFNEVLLPEFERWGIEKIKYACWEVTNVIKDLPKIVENKWIHAYFKRKPVSQDVEKVILLALLWLNQRDTGKDVRGLKKDLVTEFKKIQKLEKTIDRFLRN